MIIALPLWVLVGFAASQLIITAVVMGLGSIGVPLASVNPTVFGTVAAACIYVLTVVLVVGIPWWIKKYRTTNQDVGLTRLPTWMDIGLAPAGFVIYFLFSATLVYIASQLVPGFNIDQAQSVGFENLTQKYEFLLAFITLVIIAPFIEEVLFRGYLYGKLRAVAPMWVAIIVTSLVFGVVHGQWNVAVDVFALSVVMCGLREITGNIWAGILLHAIKNGLAFYLLFINPMILSTIGG